MKARIMKVTVASTLTLLLLAVVITPVVGKEKQATADSVFAMGMKDGGRLVIKRSPSLGNRLIVDLRIDGESASIGYGHTYRAYLRPGHHTLSVMATPKPQNVSRWEMSFDVQVGQTYTFTAQSGPKRQLILAKG